MSTTTPHPADSASRAGAWPHCTRKGNLGRQLAVHEESVPPLKREQRPQKEAMVGAPFDVLIDRSLHGVGLEPTARQTALVEQHRADVVHRRAPVPGSIGRAEPLLPAADDAFRE